MTFELRETTIEDRKCIFTDSSVIDSVAQSGEDIRVLLKVDKTPRFWSVNQVEQAYFCLLCTNGNRDSDGKWRFLLKLKDESIVFELKGYNTVNFLHNSPSLQFNLAKIRELIIDAFNVTGRWGSGDIDGVNAVPNPIFEFHPDTNESK